MAEIGQDIEKAARLLNQGGLVAVPTETVYGLAANALEADAVLKIFTAKNRPSFDPVIVHIRSVDAITKYASEVTGDALQLARECWPGPLTMLFRKNPIIPDIVTAGLDTVGLRCPDHPLTLRLLGSLHFPLAAPSANPFGYVSPTRAEHVNDMLGDRISYILDGGPCKIGIESTIVECTATACLVHRLGGVSLESLEGITGRKLKILKTENHPLAPGQLKTHYAPSKKLIIGDLATLLQTHPLAGEAGVLSFRKQYSARHEIVLSPDGILEEAARNFFAALRKLDAGPCRVIFAEQFPDVGLGRALNDRLQRAAAAA